MKTRSIIQKIFVLFIMLSLLAACGPTTSVAEEAATETNPIVIGVSLPLTGGKSEPGTAANNGYEIWAAVVNASGGLLGRQIELRVLDNASDVETARADYENLITVDKVDLVVGTFSSTLVIPTSEVVASHGYAYVEPAGGAPEVFSRGLTNIFFAQPAGSARQADPFALYIFGLPADQRPKTFAVVSLDDSFTLGVMDRLKGLLTDGGLQLVLDTTYPELESDLTDIGVQVAALDPDLILGGAQTDVDSFGQIRAYQAAGYQPRVAYFTSGPSLPESFKGTLGSATEGIFSSISWFSDSREYQNAEFVAKYVEMFGGAIGDIPEDAANAFTVGQVLQQAVEKTNSIDNSVLISELHRGNYETVVGPLSFDESGAPRGSYMLLQWQGENFVIVGPADRAEKDPQSPPKPAW